MLPLISPLVSVSNLAQTPRESVVVPTLLELCVSCVHDHVATFNLARVPGEMIDLLLRAVARRSAMTADIMEAFKYCAVRELPRQASLDDSCLARMHDWKLTHLDLGGCTGVTSEGLGELAHMTTLRSLSLRACTGVEPLGFYCLEAFLPHLRSLDLRYTHITNTQVAGLNAFGQLEELRVGTSHLNNVSILSALSGHCAFRLLDVQYTDATDALAFALKEYTALTSLNLSSTRVTDAGVMELTSLCNLTSLQLSKTHVTDAIAPALLTLRELQIVNLRGTEISNMTVDALRELPGLVHLNVTSTRVTSPCITSLARSMHPTLCLIGCGMDSRIDLGDGILVTSNDSGAPAMYETLRKSRLHGDEDMMKKALGWLRALSGRTPTDELAQIGKKADVEEIMFAMRYGVGNDSLINKGLSTLTILATSESIRSIMLEVGVIPILVTLLGSNERRICKKAASCLWNLTLDEKNREAIREAHGIEPLVVILSHEDVNIQRKASGALSNLAANDKNQRVIREYGGLRPLVDLLRSEDRQTQKNCAWTLMNLACYDDGRTPIRSANAIPRLIELLGLEDVEEQAVSALCNLAADNENKIAIANARGIEPLVRLLSSGTDPVKELAAGTLSHLTLIDDNVKDICDAGVQAIPTLMNLVHSESEAVQTSAVWALQNLALTWSSEVIRRDRGLTLLLGLLRTSPDYNVQEVVAGALMSMCNSDPESVHIALEEGIMEFLLNLLRNDASDSSRPRVVGLIATLCVEGVSVFRARGGIPLLLARMHSDDIYTQLNSAFALGYVARNDELGRSILREEGGLSLLSNMWHSDKPRFHCAAATTLANVAAFDDDFRELVLSEKMLQKIAGGLWSGDEEAQLCVTCATLHLTLNIELCSQAAEQIGLVPRLIDLLKSPDYSLCWLACDALSHIILHCPSVASIIREECVLSCILDLAKSSKSVLRTYALDVLANLLFVDEQALEVIRNLDCVATLIELLDTSNFYGKCSDLAILAHFFDTDEDVRLALWGRISFVVSLLSSENVEIQWRACFTLGMLASKVPEASRSKHALLDLTRLSNSVNHQVQRCARIALERLSLVVP